MFHHRFHRPRALLLLFVSQIVRHVLGSAHSINVYYDNAVSVNGGVKVPPVFGITQVSRWCCTNAVYTLYTSVDELEVKSINQSIN